MELEADTGGASWLRPEAATSHGLTGMEDLDLAVCGQQQQAQQTEGRRNEHQERPAQPLQQQEGVERQQQQQHGRPEEQQQQWHGQQQQQQQLRDVALPASDQWFAGQADPSDPSTATRPPPIVLPAAVPWPLPIAVSVAEAANDAAAGGTAARGRSQAVTAGELVGHDLLDAAATAGTSLAPGGLVGMQVQTRTGAKGRSQEGPGTHQGGLGAGGQAAAAPAAIGAPAGSGLGQQQQQQTARSKRVTAEGLPPRAQLPRSSSSSDSDVMQWVLRAARHERRWTKVDSDEDEAQQQQPGGAMMGSNGAECVKAALRVGRHVVSGNEGASAGEWGQAGCQAACGVSSVQTSEGGSSHTTHTNATGSSSGGSSTNAAASDSNPASNEGASCGSASMGVASSGGACSVYSSSGGASSTDTSSGGSISVVTSSGGACGVGDCSQVSGGVRQSAAVATGHGTPCLHIAADTVLPQPVLPTATAAGAKAAGAAVPPTGSATAAAPMPQQPAQQLGQQLAPVLGQLCQLLQALEVRLQQQPQQLQGQAPAQLQAPNPAPLPLPGPDHRPVDAAGVTLAQPRTHLHSQGQGAGNQLPSRLQVQGQDGISAGLLDHTVSAHSSASSLGRTSASAPARRQERLGEEPGPALDKAAPALAAGAAGAGTAGVSEATAAAGVSEAAGAAGAGAGVGYHTFRLLNGRLSRLPVHDTEPDGRDAGRVQSALPHAAAQQPIPPQLPVATPPPPPQAVLVAAAGTGTQAGAQGRLQPVPGVKGEDGILGATKSQGRRQVASGDAARPGAHATPPQAQDGSQLAPARQTAHSIRQDGGAIPQQGSQISQRGGQVSQPLDDAKNPGRRPVYLTSWLAGDSSGSSGSMPGSYTRTASQGRRWSPFQGPKPAAAETVGTGSGERATPVAALQGVQPQAAVQRQDGGAGLNPGTPGRGIGVHVTLTPGAAVDIRSGHVLLAPDQEVQDVPSWRGTGSGAQATGRGTAALATSSSGSRGHGTQVHVHIDPGHGHGLDGKPGSVRLGEGGWSIRVEAPPAEVPVADGEGSWGSSGGVGGQAHGGGGTLRSRVLTMSSGPVAGPVRQLDLSNGRLAEVLQGLGRMG